MTNQRLGQTPVVFQPLGGLAGPAIECLGTHGITLAPLKIRQRDRRVYFGGTVARFGSEIELLLKQEPGALKIAGLECSLAKAPQRHPAAPDIARSLGSGIGVAKELFTFPARVVGRQESIEPERRIDHLPVKALGMGGGVRQAGQGDRKFPVRLRSLGDHGVERAEVGVGQSIQHRRLANLVQGTG